MTAYLPPVEHPKGVLMKLTYAVTRRMFGKVPTPLSVNSARMPYAFFRFQSKIARLNRKLTLPEMTQFIIGQQVAATNGCAFCMDLQRWFVAKRLPGLLERFDALPQYRTSPLFSDADRAALDYATELTERKHVSPDTFAALSRHYNEREICEIVWLVASEHVYNITNHGLNIGSDGLCRIPAGETGRAAGATANGAPLRDVTPVGAER